MIFIQFYSIKCLAGLPVWNLNNHHQQQPIKNQSMENESISSSFTGFKLYFLLVLILEIWIFMEAMGERGKKKKSFFFKKILLLYSINTILKKKTKNKKPKDLEISLQPPRKLNSKRGNHSKSLDLE